MNKKKQEELALQMSQKHDYLHSKISEVRNIIFETVAIYRKGLKLSVGFLFLTEDAIEFYSQKIFFFKELNLAILLDDIKKVESKNNKLVIVTTDNKYILSIPAQNHAATMENAIKGIL